MASTQQGPRRRRKTFTGCWTCRSRHVKCDEQRPACTRCIAGNFTCGGYGVRLTWVSAPGKVGITKDQHHASAKRRNVGPTRRSFAHVPGGVSPLPGSFSVFSVGGQDVRQEEEREHGKSTSKHERLNGVEIRDSNTLETADIVDRSHSTELETIPEPDNNLGAPIHHAFDLDLFNDLSTIMTPSGPNTSSSELPNTWPTEDATFIWTDRSSSSSEPLSLTSSSTEPLQDEQNSLEMHSHNPIINTLNPYLLQSQAIGSIPRHLDVLPAPSQHRHLINHWVLHLCDKLMPTRSPINPFLSVISPMALEGSRTSHSKSSSTTALFHAVCAASAAHQANLKANSLDLTTLSLQHMNLSVQNLTQNINSTDPEERLASLGTLCVWLAIYHITGTIGVWRDVIKVVCNLLHQTAIETWTLSTSAALTYQCYAAFITLVQSQYLSRPGIEFPAPLRIDLVGLDIVKSQAIPQRSLELVSEFNGKVLGGEIMGDEELDRLEIEFALSTPPIPDSQGMMAQDGNAAYHHSMLFYHACLLYFRSTTGRLEPQHEIKHLVSKCLDHIEALDGLKDGGCPRTWIYALVAFEARAGDVRERVRKAFERRKEGGFGTWGVVLRAAEEVWKRKDGSEGVGWSEVLAELPQLDVLWY